eukprot:403342427
MNSSRRLTQLIEDQNQSGLYNYLMEQKGENSTLFLFKLKTQVLTSLEQPLIKSISPQEHIQFCEGIRDQIDTDNFNNKESNYRNLTHNQKNKLSHMIAALSQYESIKVNLLRKTKVQFDKTNQEHEGMLEELWNILKPDKKRTERITADWIDIGFQGKDPVTDFRGTGLLGLQHLMDLCRQKQSEALRMYEDSTHPDHWYFFAVTGINITSKLWTSLKKGVFDTMLLNLFNKHGLLFNDSFSKSDNNNSNIPRSILTNQNQKTVVQIQKTNLTDQNLAQIISEELIYEIFVVFYYEIFAAFNESWCSRKRDIMEFNQFIERIFTEQFLPSSQGIADKFLKNRLRQ